MCKNDISIIVPTYNSEHTIERLLTSINSSFKNLNIDLLLVDDGSNDRTVLIEEEYSFNENIHTNIIKLSHSGVSVARNVGIQKAQGKYLMFLDSDDEVSEEITSLLKDFNHFNSQVVSFSPDTLDIHDGKEVRKDSINFLTISMLYNKCGSFIPNEYEMSVSNKLYLNQFVKQSSIKFDQNLKCWEDLFFNMRVLIQTDSLLMKKGTIFIYNHDNENSVTHRKSESIIRDAKYVYEKCAFIFNNNQSMENLLTKVEASYFISHIVGGYFVFNPNIKLYNSFIKVIPLRNSSYKYANTVQHKFILWGLRHLGFTITTSIYRGMKAIQYAIIASHKRA